MNAAAKAAGSIASKALAINIFPAPANLAESREILRVLQSYGEVTTYKAFKHEKNNFAPNRALAIYRSHTSAANFQEACPLYFTLERVTRDDDDDSSHNPADGTCSLPNQNHRTHPNDLAPDAGSVSHDAQDSLELDPSSSGTSDFNLITQPRTSPSSESTLLRDAEELKRPPSLLFAPTSPLPPLRPPKAQIGFPFEPIEPMGSKVVQKQFRLTARPWQGSHRDYLSGTKFWGPFKASRSAASADLQRRLPPGSMGSIGLSDVDVWGVGEVPERIRMKRLEQGAGRKRLRMMRLEDESQTKAGGEIGRNVSGALE